MSTVNANEIATGSRFDFGHNWSRFVAVLNEDRIRRAEQSLCDSLRVSNLQGQRFLDVGCGSGLFSLAARRLGAIVHSFDYDSQSVACAEELKRRHFPADNGWRIEAGSVLDREYLQTLGQWDIVYSWGVLHHTGKMSDALANVVALVGKSGRLFISIYNDQGRASGVWLRIKKTYNWLPPGLRWLVLWPAALRIWGPTTIRDLLAGRPFHTWRKYSEESLRGMSPWLDVVDWVGGLPFEVATPETVFAFYRDRGFELQELRTCGGGRGCNEFVFRKAI